MSLYERLEDVIGDVSYLRALGGVAIANREVVKDLRWIKEFERNPVVSIGRKRTERMMRAAAELVVFIYRALNLGFWRGRNPAKRQQRELSSELRAIVQAQHFRSGFKPDLHPYYHVNS